MYFVFLVLTLLTLYSMFVPAAMTRTQMTSTGVLVGSVAGAVIVLLAVVAVAVVIVVFRRVTHLYT